MQIIKSKFFRPRKCAYGNFELKPEEGWKLSQTYIDFESGLLVVSESDENKSNWKHLGYGSIIPSRQFIINLETLEILSPSEWKKYFNYDKVIFITDDNKYKLSTKRIHEPENNTDSIEEELEYLETGRKSTSTSVAFREEKRENLLEYIYRDIREIEERKRILDAKPSLEEFYKKQLEELNDNDDILCYFDDAITFKLVFSNSKFELFEGGKLPTEYGGWKSMRFSKIKIYNNLNEFWEDFIKVDKWFLKYRVHQTISTKILIFAKHITSFFNNLRKQHDFTYEEYDKINEWSNTVWSEDYKGTEIKQWCTHCYKEVNFYGRYPKYICRECASKDKFDKNGNLVDDSQKEYECLIDNKPYFAKPARFGGTVIQTKE